MTFWVGVVCGLWVGAPIGFVFAAILAAGKDPDTDMNMPHGTP